MAKYTIIVEKANGNYSTHCPDLPGCIATGKTEDDTIETMKQAIRSYLQGLKEGNIPLPDVKCTVQQVEVTI